MDTIYNLFSKDLAAIVEAYSRDRTKYDQVLFELSDFLSYNIFVKKFICLYKVSSKWPIENTSALDK